MIEAAILRSFAEVWPRPMFALSASGQFLYANASFKRLAASSILPGDCASSVFGPNATVTFHNPEPGPGQERIDDDVLLNGATFTTLRYPLALPDGTVGIVGIVLGIIKAGTGKTVLDGTGSLTAPGLAQLAQIGERQKAELADRLRVAELLRREAVEAAQRDPATGLRNRIGLDFDIDTVISEKSFPGRSRYLLFLDLDHFKQINDSFGHPTGDRVLRAVARRFKALRGVRSAARIGGDEFAILIEYEATGHDDFVRQISSLAPRIFGPVRTDGRTIPVSGSIGVSVFGVDAYDAATLKLNADTALIEAKRLGKNQVKVFDRELARRSNRRRVLERDLKRAVCGEVLVPYFQPIIPIRGCGACGAEVLARWTHPVLGPISPEEFVSIASESGFISELDFGVMRSACAAARDLILSGNLAFISFINSPLEILRAGHAEAFLQTLDDFGIPSRNVCVEIVESDFIRDLPRATIALNKFRAAGVSIALDDFGTGYSNLSALLDLPIDKIKIDRSLITHVAHDERSMRLVLSLVQLARILKAELVAEGVQDPAQAAVLRSMGCKYLQGFGLCPPLPASDLRHWLANQRRIAA